MKLTKLICCVFFCQENLLSLTPPSMDPLRKGESVFSVWLVAVDFMMHCAHCICGADIIVLAVSVD